MKEKIVVQYYLPYPKNVPGIGLVSVEYRDPTPSELIVEATRLIRIENEKNKCQNPQPPTPPKE
jgi:hypothetical protein